MRDENISDNSFTICVVSDRADMIAMLKAVTEPGMVVASLSAFPYENPEYPRNLDNVNRLDKLYLHANCFHSPSITTIRR